MEIKAAMSRLALAALTATVAGCGGGSAPSSGPEETAAIAAVIKKAVSTTDPADCTRLMTQRFVEQSELSKGRAALKRCEEDVGDASGNPRSTIVSNVRIDGDTARARAAFDGGDLDGQAVNLRVIRDGEGWKVDHIDSFARFDRKRLLRATENALRRPPQELSADAAGCIPRRLDKLSDAALQQVFLSGDPGPVAAVAGPCMIGMFRREFVRQGVPKSVAECMVGKLDKPPYDTIRRLLGGADPEQLLQPIVQACVAG